MATATVTETKLLTAEEFARLPNPPDGSKQELVKGQVVTMPSPGFRHGGVQGNVYFALRLYTQTHPIGRVRVESGIVTETDPATVRGPDVSFWSFERLPADQNPVGYPAVAADLCVEVLSPSNRRGEMNEKISEYFARDVRMVWIVDPEGRTVTVYRQPGEGRILWETATLAGEDVLPGFTCRVGEFFE
jgi:Uma2 family endonuclease